MRITVTMHWRPILSKSSANSTASSPKDFLFLQCIDIYYSMCVCATDGKQKPLRSSLTQQNRKDQAEGDPHLFREQIWVP